MEENGFDEKRVTELEKRNSTTSHVIGNVIHIVVPHIRYSQFQDTETSKDFIIKSDRESEIESREPHDLHRLS